MDIFGYIRGGNVPAPKNDGKQMGKMLLKQALGHRQILYTKCNLCGENWDKFICPDCLLKLIEIIRVHEIILNNKEQ